MSSGGTDKNGLGDVVGTRSLPAGWRPFLREADLTRMCFATGLNALAKANHAEKGYYTQAFFNISVGLERLLKLIFLIDFALANEGSFPTENILRNRFRHDIERLFKEAVEIRGRLQEEGETFNWGLQDAKLARRIIKVLSEFARSTRYYNLDYLVGARGIGRDPIEAWATDVGQYLATTYPARRRTRDEEWAREAEELLGDCTVVLQESESGRPIRTVQESVLHGRLGEWVQQAATFHCACTVRYLAEILTVLNDRAGPGSVTLQLPFLSEFFAVFLNEDRYLKGKKTFI